MAGHQDQSMAFKLGRKYSREPGAQFWSIIQQSGDPQQSINSSIAGHQNPIAADPLSQQIIACSCGRGEVKVGDLGDEPAVYFFGPRRIDIVGAQTVLIGYSIDLVCMVK
jgi:hypothetical protein